MQNAQAGDVIGRYELVREVSKGFPGSLWLLNFQHGGQRMLALGRLVQRNEAISDAIWEALAESSWDAMEVAHECVACAADLVFEPARLLTVYDYVEGEPLTVLDRLKTVQNVPFPAPVALRITIDLLDGLEALHATSLQLGTVGAFGGVGPDSILVGTDGRTRLLDVYVAGPASEQAELRLLPERVRYVAPEQFAEELVDSRADVYAAGCVLWELLGNRRMHIGASQAVERRVRLGQLPPLRPPGPLEKAVIDAVEKALKLDPRHRFGSSKAMADELRAAATNIAEPNVVAAFVGKLANRQLETRRKATEQSTIARLRDLLDSRPPPRRERRNVAPPRPIAASALVSTAPGVGAAISPKATLLGMQAPDASRRVLDAKSPRALSDDSDGPTIPLPQKLLASMIHTAQGGVSHDAETVPAQPAAAPPAHRGLNHGTLLGMPVPESAASFRESLRQSAQAHASAPAPRPPSQPAVAAVQTHRLVSLEPGPPTPSSRDVPAEPLAVSASADLQRVHDQAPAPVPAQAPGSDEEEMTISSPAAAKKNWRPLVWGLGAASVGLLILIPILWFSDDRASSGAAPVASQQNAASVVASAAEVAPSKPAAAEAPAQPAADEPPEPAVAATQPATSRMGVPRKNPGPRKKTPKKFVPDGL